MFKIDLIAVFKYSEIIYVKVNMTRTVISKLSQHIKKKTKKTIISTTQEFHFDVELKMLLNDN